jgi:hypothetical protein
LGAAAAASCAAQPPASAWHLPATHLILLPATHACTALCPTQARRTANSWKTVDLQQLTRECTHGGALDAKRLAWLKPLVRRGIPVELRPTLWPLLSGGAARQAAAAPGTYARLAASARASLPRDTQLTLKEDLSPGVFTFRSHPVFKAASGGGLAALQRLVSAYLVHNPGGWVCTRGVARVACC